MKFSGDYVRTANNTKSFDWTAFKAAVDKYPGDDLSFDKFKSTTIARSEATVDVMVQKIVDFLLQALSVVIDTKELAATITATFTNLKNASSHDSVAFHTTTTSSNSAWEYRILFALPNPDLTDFFYSLVTTIKLEANIQTEKEWWGLMSNTTKNFSATIDAMELVVMKGFKNPDQ
jgi:hypothetical protein